jgi:hypothetical protein
MIRHRRGLHCIHIHGWSVNEWCSQCHKALMEFQAPFGEEPRLAFERYVDAMLAIYVCHDMEGGLIPIPAVVASLGLPERPPWPPAPSAN